jgi:hypothetical protein
MQREKKQLELVSMHFFMACYPDFPKGRLISSESPDFIVARGKRNRLGIELTRIAPFCDHAMDEKLSLYQKQRLNGYWLIIFTDMLLKSGRPHLADRIMDQSFHSGFQHIFLFEWMKPKIFQLV